jgi:hypothetical protein
MMLADRAHEASVPITGKQKTTFATPAPLFMPHKISYHLLDVEGINSILLATLA